MSSGKYFLMRCLQALSDLNSRFYSIKTWRNVDACYIYFLWVYVCPKNMHFSKTNAQKRTPIVHSLFLCLPPKTCLLTQHFDGHFRNFKTTALGTFVSFSCFYFLVLCILLQTIEDGLFLLNSLYSFVRQSGFCLNLCARATYASVLVTTVSHVSQNMHVVSYGFHLACLKLLSW